MHDKFVLLAITGTLSITSWYSAMILGVTRGFDFSYGLIINTYLLVVIAGILFAYVLLVVVLFPKKTRATSPVTTPKSRRTPRPLVGTLLALAVGMILVIAAWYGAKLASPVDKQGDAEAVAAEVFTGESHVVCITEDRPWFTPTVVRIAVGDTVIWDHCHDELGQTIPNTTFASRLLSLLITPVQAKEADWPEAYTHTHAIASVSGPVSFSSDFKPVGHVYEGDSFMVTFSEPGTYEYTSPTHRYMRGQVVVGESDVTTLAWPPSIPPAVSDIPATPGIGEVWVSLQFARAFGQLDPGALAVLDASTWEVTNILEDAAFHNPYQLTYVASTDTILSTQWHSDRVVAINRADYTVVDGERNSNAPAQIITHPTSGEVFVAIHNESRVAVLDPTGNWLRDITVPFGPHGLAVSNDGQSLAVVSSLRGEFALVSLESEQIVQLLELPGSPQEVVLTPDDEYAIVSAYDSDQLRVIATQTGTIVREIAIASQSQGLTIDPTGQQVWVVNAGADSVEIIDLATWSVVGSIPVAASPHSIAFGQKDGGGYYAYVTHRFARTLSVLDVATQTVAGAISLGSEGLGGAGLLVFDKSTTDATIIPPTSESP